MQWVGKHLTNVKFSSVWGCAPIERVGVQSGGAPGLLVPAEIVDRSYGQERLCPIVASAPHMADAGAADPG